jgi:hypothetical protein
MLKKGVTYMAVATEVQVPRLALEYPVQYSLDVVCRCNPWHYELVAPSPVQWFLHPVPPC